MKKILSLILMTVFVMLCSVCYPTISTAANSSSNATVARAKQKAYDGGFVLGCLVGWNGLADENDYDKIAKMKEIVNDDSNSKTQKIIKHLNILMTDFNSNDVSVPRDTANAYKEACGALLGAFQIEYDLMFDEDKEVRCLTSEEMSQIDASVINAAEKFMIWSDVTNRYFGEGSIKQVNINTYRQVAIGKKYVDFVLKFNAAGTLINSEQGVVDGTVVKYDTYRWTQGSASITVDFENGRAVKISPSNL